MLQSHARANNYHDLQKGSGNTTTDKKHNVSFLKNTVNTALQYYQILLGFNTKKMEVKSIHKLAPSHLSELLN